MRPVPAVSGLRLERFLEAAASIWGEINSVPDLLNAGQSLNSSDGLLGDPCRKVAQCPELRWR